MTLNDQKEHFSKAYVRAVAATAGFVVHQPLDFDSDDLEVGAPGGGSTIRSPKVGIQVKCTAAPAGDLDTVGFALPLKNYNDLRQTNLMVQKILVVVLVPEDVTLWLEHSEAGLILRKCGYWYSLYGAAETHNTTSVTVAIPRRHQFTTEALRGIMDRLGKGELP